MEENKVESRRAREEDRLVFTCNECNFKFITKGDIEEHVKRNHNNEVDFVCSECKQMFPKGDDYQEHMKSHKQWPVICYYCEKCEYKTEENAEMNLHIENKHKTAGKCNSCEFITETEETLNVYNDNKHNDHEEVYKLKDALKKSRDESDVLKRRSEKIEEERNALKS